MKEKNEGRMKIVHKITYWLGVGICIILIPLLIANITIIIKGILYPDQVPTIFGVAPMAVLSDSMNVGEGSIAAGDLIFAKTIEADKLSPGDIILFGSGNSYIIHRIVREEIQNEQRVFVTKGDANNTEDTNVVREDMLVGRYTGRLAGIGHFVLFMKTPSGMMLFVGLPVCTFFIYDFIKRSREMKKKQQKILQMQKEVEELRK